MSSEEENGDRQLRATRRGVLSAASAATATGALTALFSDGVAAENVEPMSAKGNGTRHFNVERSDVRSVYPQSVASGGPTPSGAIVWTRIDPAAYEADTPLAVEVASDDAFEEVVYRGVVPADEITPDDDYTVNADLDGELGADRHYFYRFVYDGDASPVGRCRTLPEPSATPDELSFAVLSCNNYLHGYFGAMAHVAEEDVDYLLHLGDFIYEYAGEGQQPGRDIRLPSGEEVAFGLDDFRHLHRTYRSDEFMQAMLERHTLIHTWDDHEIVNNRWWNYDEGVPETESHPNGGDPEFMKRLYVEGIEAYTEFVPARLEYEPSGETIAEENIHEEFRLYRSFQFGDLCELFMTDERLYRSPPPEDAFGRRDTGVPPTDETEDADRTMLGRDQRQWFTDGVVESDATWKVWGNEVLAAPLKVANLDDLSLYLNYDAWDGYEHERKQVMGEFAFADVENFVALTGDMHSYVSCYLLEEYETARQTLQLPDEDQRVGVEFMAPGVTSNNLASVGKLPADETEKSIELAVESQNPHIEWFNSSRWGYTVVELTRDECLYTAYGVDRTTDSADAAKRLLRSYRVPEGRVELQEFNQSALSDAGDALVGDVVDGIDDDPTTNPDGPDVFGSSDAAGGDGL